MDYETKVLTDKQVARSVSKFLTSSDAFDQTWAPNEKALVEQATLESTEPKGNHRYWYIKHEGKIIAALGIRENKYESSGYEMDSDYVAVHKEYRRLGLASKLLEEAEKYVKGKKGRYVHVVTCDIGSYKPALAFYEKHGYQKVGAIPDYYVPGEGRVDYFKKM